MITDRVKNHKSEGGEILSFVQECPFCHQNVMIEYLPGMTDQEINQLVIETCTCYKARTEAHNKERIEQLEECLEKVLTEYEKENLKTQIWMIGSLVCTMKVEKVTVNINKKNKLVIKRNNKGNVIIERETKSTAQEVF